MCTKTEELRKRADWEGKGGTSRAKLMEQLQGVYRSLFTVAIFKNV